MAVAEWPQIGLGRWTPERWAKVIADRTEPATGPQADMASHWSAPAPPAKPAAADPKQSNPAPGSAVKKLV